MGTSPPNLARPIGHWGNGGTQWQDRGVIPGLPQREANPDLPPAVTIYEVGPRDGLQNEKAVVPVEVKA